MKMRSFVLRGILFLSLLLNVTALWAQAGDGSSLYKMLDREDSCRLQLMQKMGWTLNFNQSATKNNFDVHEGNPCDRSDWVNAMGHRDLKIDITYPTSGAYLNSSFFKNSIKEAFKGRATKCAYKHRYHEALKMGTTKMIRNTHTNGLNFGTVSDSKFCMLPRTWWKGTTFIKGWSDGYCLMPRLSNYEALKCVYNGHGKVECAVGLQLASLVAILELYGKEINKSFSKKEMAVGVWQQVAYSGHPVHSQVIEGMNPEQPASWWGPQEFVGLTGYVGSAIDDESLLDSERDRGENFIIVDSTKRATEDFARKGLQHFTDLSMKAWKLNREYYVRKARGEKKEKLVRIANERDALLNTPFLTETLTYVHPLGYKTLASHIQRLMVINPRMPYNLKFYGDTTNGYQYKRYVNYFMSKCMKGRAI